MTETIEPILNWFETEVSCKTDSSSSSKYKFTDYKYREHGYLQEMMEKAVVKQLIYLQDWQWAF